MAPLLPRPDHVLRQTKEVAAAVALDGPCWPHIERIFGNVLRGVMALDAITTLTLR
jgi:hypothetical protein